MTRKDLTALLRIYRGDEHATRDPLEREVTVPRGCTLLDALIWVRDIAGIDIAFDYACETNNSCKLCYLRVNGAPAYACTFQLTAGGHYDIGPIDSRRPHKDLFLLRDGVW